MGALAARTDVSEKRADIIHLAFEVFYKEGFHASGVDSLLKGSGISKRTLYKYFESKEDLIQATILHYQGRALSSIANVVDNASGDRVLAVFDWLESVIASGHAAGCYAINAKLEFANRDKRIEKICDAYFVKMQDLFTELCRESKVRDPKKVALQIHMLFQGAILNSQIHHDIKIAQNAKSAAKLILESSRAK